MASAFAHVVVPTVIYSIFKSKYINLRLFLLASILAVLPDADVIAFKFGIPYESQWGHRGFTHSLIFAALLSALLIPFHRQLRSQPKIIFFVCFIACASHAVLDAMTNGGLGVALFWPLSSERIFFPFRPIQVSPIGVGRFFTEKGLRVISSELVWVFLPGFVLAVIGVMIRRRCAKRQT